MSPVVFEFVLNIFQNTSMKVKLHRKNTIFGRDT